MVGASRSAGAFTRERSPRDAPASRPASPVRVAQLMRLLQVQTMRVCATDHCETQNIVTFILAEAAALRHHAAGDQLGACGESTAAQLPAAGNANRHGQAPTRCAPRDVTSTR